MKIDERKFYLYLYSLFDGITPLKGDCGVLCGGACCKDETGDAGMYLFPYEEKVYEPCPNWATISETDFTYGKGKRALLLQCPDRCDRSLRPLACRIFPLVPYIDKDGNLQVIPDPRAKGLCPLADGKNLDIRFMENVVYASYGLMKIRECREFLIAQSRLIDEWERWY